MCDHVSIGELLERWRVGDQAAASEIDRRFRSLLCDKVHAWIGQPLRRRFDEEDIVQSTLSSFFRHARCGEYTTDSREEIFGLLVGKAYYKTKQKVEYHRAQKRDARHETSADTTDLSSASLEIMFGLESVVVLRDLIEVLSPADAEIIWLYLNGWNKSEIAKKIDRSRFAVKRNLDRTIAVLRTHWDQESGKMTE